MNSVQPICSVREGGRERVVESDSAEYEQKLHENTAWKT